ncbi:MAG TPA: hypothetical protein VLE43_05610 [Candidatus Saccharimonadia bacterium]|nr:hypothetical protein [Candidatus Saccharimonadia bacterium]
MKKLAHPGVLIAFAVAYLMQVDAKADAPPAAQEPPSKSWKHILGKGDDITRSC